MSFDCRRLAGRAWPLVVCGTLASAPVLQAADTRTISDVAPGSVTTTEASPFDTSDHQKLDRYAANLGRNLKGVLGSSSVRPLLIGTALALGASRLDDRAVSYFDRHPYRAAGRTGATLGQGLVVAGMTAGLFGAGALSPDGRFKHATYDLSQAVLVNTAYTFALKSTIKRTRPDGSNALSFPSGHTSTAFAAATVLQSHYGLKAGIPAYGIASFIGASRMASKAHHLSDVLAGATLGYVVGRTVTGQDGRAGRERKFAIGTTASPSGDGVGLRLTLGF
jgi:membrane-associated phospholipid phosphatase